MLTTLTIDFNGAYIDALIYRDFEKYEGDSKYLVIMDPFGEYLQPAVFYCSQKQFIELINYYIVHINKPFVQQYKILIQFCKSIQEYNKFVNPRHL